mmetsp:Transcript_94723/g.277037  ORF Transcript_94723/g.277037 Transcript_94723/m.277037 type:complete len:248 (-) Transcript_94723:8-751(-)
MDCAAVRCVATTRAAKRASPGHARVRTPIPSRSWSEGSRAWPACRCQPALIVQRPGAGSGPRAASPRLSRATAQPGHALQPPHRSPPPAAPDLSVRVAALSAECGLQGGGASGSRCACGPTPRRGERPRARRQPRAPAWNAGSVSEAPRLAARLSDLPLATAPWGPDGVLDAAHPVEALRCWGALVCAPPLRGGCPAGRRPPSAARGGQCAPTRLKAAGEQEFGAARPASTGALLVCSWDVSSFCSI